MDGLAIHPSKTKIFSNQTSGKQKEITIDNIKIEILHKKVRVHGTSGKK